MARAAGAARPGWHRGQRKATRSSESVGSSGSVREVSELAEVVDGTGAIASELSVMNVNCELIEGVTVVDTVVTLSVRLKEPVVDGKLITVPLPVVVADSVLLPVIVAENVPEKVLLPEMVVMLPLPVVMDELPEIGGLVIDAL